MSATEHFCRVYWGSHGCDLPRGHDGDHVCSCAIEDEGLYDPITHEYYDEPGVFNVGRAPYYAVCASSEGKPTVFYGEDAPPS